MLRLVVVLAIVIGSSRPADACVQHPEANKLIGWSKDGSVALFARVDKAGKLVHAELHPTRYEGFEFLIREEGNAIAIKKIAIGSCKALEDATTHERVTGKLTDESLMKLSLVEKLEIVSTPTDDGGASKLAAAFTPKARYAEHRVEVKEGDNVVATLPVPVWCVGSCFRDEAHEKWTASVRTVAKAGDRTLYVVRMTGVCNAANDKELWMDRVIAVPDKETIPRRRCKGSGQ